MRILSLIFIHVLFLTSAQTLSAGAAPNPENDEILVRLSTATPLLPVYIANWDSSPSLGQDYIQQLQKVLAYDLSHNGRTAILEHSSERAAQAKKEGFSKAMEAAAWRKFNTFCVIKGKAGAQSLTATCCSVSNAGEGSSFEIPLSGQLSQDRRHIHHLADQIHKALFGTEGIAASKIIFTIKQKGATEELSTSEIWVADYDGHNAQQVTHENSYCITPAFIPPAPGQASGNFFYVSYQMGQPKIYLASLKEGKGRRFTQLKGSQLMPAISPRRDLVAFISDAAGNPDLFIQQFNPEVGVIGKPRQIFACARAAQGTPTFNNKGNKIAFVSNKDGPPRIYVIDVPPLGSSIKEPRTTLVSKQNRENTSPAWSPDGTKLAYSSVTNGVRQIWIYDFTTGEEFQLTQGSGHKENPTWASNSFHLMFNSADNDSCELYLVNLNQPKAARITAGSGEKRFPSWGACRH